MYLVSHLMLRTCWRSTWVKQVECKYGVQLQHWAAATLGLLDGFSLLYNIHCIHSSIFIPLPSSSPLKAVGLYSISKTALLGLTKALAAELGSDNIRVNCIAPGIIKTRFSSAVRQVVLWTQHTVCKNHFHVCSSGRTRLSLKKLPNMYLLGGEPVHHTIIRSSSNMHARTHTHTHPHSLPTPHHQTRRAQWLRRYNLLPLFRRCCLCYRGNHRDCRRHNEQTVNSIRVRQAQILFLILMYVVCMSLSGV